MCRFVGMWRTTTDEAANYCFVPRKLSILFDFQLPYPEKTMMTQNCA